MEDARGERVAVSALDMAWALYTWAAVEGREDAIVDVELVERLRVYRSLGYTESDELVPQPEPPRDPAIEWEEEALHVLREWEGC